MNNILQNKLLTEEAMSTRRRFLCPICEKHTVLWLLPDTEIRNLPMKCKRCKGEIIVTVEPPTEP